MNRFGDYILWIVVLLYFNLKGESVQFKGQLQDNLAFNFGRFMNVVVDFSEIRSLESVELFILAFYFFFLSKEADLELGRINFLFQNDRDGIRFLLFPLSKAWLIKGFFLIMFMSLVSLSGLLKVAPLRLIVLLVIVSVFGVVIGLVIPILALAVPVLTLLLVPILPIPVPLVPTLVRAVLLLPISLPVVIEVALAAHLVSSSARPLVLPVPSVISGVVI